jgi:hypothetical protein
MVPKWLEPVRKDLEKVLPKVNLPLNENMRKSITGNKD